MQHAPQTTRPASPLTVPHAFRRTTGAHAIIASILVADLLGVLIWVLLGALGGPPIWWLLRAFVHLLHASLGFDLILILVLGGVASRSFLQSWAIPGTLMVFIVVITCVLWLLRPGWMTVPSPIPAFVPREAPSWQLLFLPQGAMLALLLSLVAHAVVLRRAQAEKLARSLTLSRAHPGDPLWRLVARAYALFGESLTRFQPSLVGILRTPDTFYYSLRHLSANATELRDPEHEMDWHDGTLVLSQAYIGPHDEQTRLLLPILARLLARNTWAEQRIGWLFRLAHTARQKRLTAWLLAVPLYIQASGEQHWNRQARERVLEGDWFAYACGQGPRLRRVLRAQLDMRTDNALPDHTIPTLTERINYLRSLIFQEEQQVRHLRAPASASLTPPASEESEVSQ